MVNQAEILEEMIMNCRVGLLFCAVITYVFGSAGHGTAADWPQWRGPQRDGISSETGLLHQWPSEGPKLLWMVKDVGSGYSTPSVTGQYLYLLGNQGLEDEFVEARDATDGKLIWSKHIGKVGNPDQKPAYSGARSTPTVDGSFLYALGSDGGLVCFDSANGEVKWHKNLRTDFGGQPGIWAYAESPLIDGDTLICTPGGAEATLIALNKKSGDVSWKCVTPEADQAAYASALGVPIDGHKQYVQFLQKGLVGVDPKNGQVLWRYTRTAQGSMANIPTPVADGNYIYTATGMVGCGLVKIKENNGTFDAEQVYFSAKLSNAIGGTVKINDYLYGTNSQALQCIDFKTGEIKWSDRSIGPGSICYADGCLYVHGENGDVALVEATPEGYREKGRFTPSDPPNRGQSKSWTYPVVANGRLYIRDQDHLWCYEVKAATGTQ
jgi:outer membrane protein assembly factor BamB